MLRSHNNLKLKLHTRSNMSVQRRNGQQTWILTWLCPKFHTPLPDSDIADALTQPESENEGQSHGDEYKQAYRARGWVQNPHGCAHCINTPLSSPATLHNSNAGV